MEKNEPKNHPHFILQRNAETERFVTPPRQFNGPPIPSRDRTTHGGNLLGKIQQLAPILASAVEKQLQTGLETDYGLQIEFESFPNIELAFESLAREASGIELRNVRNRDEKTFATVFVPDGKLTFFEKKFIAYLDEDKDNASGPAQGKLINAIADIRAATLEALWTDTSESMPINDDEFIWWEVWLPVRGDRNAVTAMFRELALGLDFRVAPGELIFPERTVLIIYGAVGQMKRSMMTLNTIAELRKAKETADFFDSLPPQEQPEWIEELLLRTSFPASDEKAPYVCLLDTGANNRHPLLQPILSDADRHTVEPSWGVDDRDGHGTGIAGIAMYGDLTHIAQHQNPVILKHRLESVKLIPKDGSNADNAEHHGYLTNEAVSRAEITAPQRMRVFSMAVTAKDNRDRGRPSAWSATIDRLAYDADAQNGTPRLFVLSAGNIDNPNAWMNYPASNTTDAIHDPAQAWNALTIGATTNLVKITEPDTHNYQPIADAGGLSPFSTTSQTWQSIWPLKPDVVFEGGNVAKDKLGAAWMPSLSLLTADNKINQRLFTTTNATSAASGLAAKMAAELMSEYSKLWPETIRALMVHSASWTEAMKKMFLPQNGTPTKGQIANLVRHCGFGQPSLEKALWSVSNSLTMISEEALHPFKFEKGKGVKLRDMNLHRLPWPLNELEALGEADVEMRVTLSYFIEPNPSSRGVTSRYRYESHGLRFDVKRPLESTDDFRARINAAARNEEEGTRMSSDDDNWLLGKNGRHRGSLHSDIWRGKAAELASRGVLAVYPSLGWWKTRPALEQYNQLARYSLVISIKAPDIDIDLYTPIANILKVPIVIG